MKRKRHTLLGFVDKRSCSRPIRYGGDLFLEILGQEIEERLPFYCLGVSKLLGGRGKGEGGGREGKLRLRWWCNELG